MKLDFSKEDLKGTPVPICDGVWVCGEAHHPAGVKNFNWNNRAFVFKLKLNKEIAGVKAGSDVLFIMGLGKRPILEGIKGLEEKTGLPVVAMMVNGGDHHISIKFWYDAFPKLRVWICPARVPLTSNGKYLMENYPDRWELADNTTVKHHVYQLQEYFGDQVDCVLFNQLYVYSDKTGKETGCWCAPEDEPKLWSNLSALTQLAGKQFMDFSCPLDETVFFHKASKLIVTGHHMEFIYCPPDKPLPTEMEAVGWGFKILQKMFISKGRYMTTYAAGTDERIRDPAIHAEQWQEVLKWDFEYSCGHHDVVGAVVPIGNDAIENGDGGLKGHFQRMLEASGELSGKADPGSWWPYKPANAIYKLQQAEPKCRAKYGEPPELRFGGPGYNAEGLKKE